MVASFCSLWTAEVDLFSLSLSLQVYVFVNLGVRGEVGLRNSGREGGGD